MTNKCNIFIRYKHKAPYLKNPITGTIKESVRTIRTYIYESVRNDWFFCYQKNHRKDLSMVNIIKEEIEIEESLKSRLRAICDFCNTIPII